MNISKKTITTALIFTCCIITGLTIINSASAALDAETTLLRVEVEQKRGEIVEISVPLGLLDVLYKVMPKEIHQACEKLELTPKTIMKELSTLEGEDLVRITGEDKVRVWFEPITDENRKQLNFITVHVKEDQDDDKGQDIHVKVPKGLVKLAARVIQELGLVEEFVELPPEVRKALKRITNEDNEKEDA